jgi:hypothetical protein
MCHCAWPVLDVCVMTGAPVARDASAAALNSRSAGLARSTDLDDAAAHVPVGT